MVDRAQKASGPGPVDTEDRIMEKIAQVTTWAQRNSRVATLALLLLVGAVGAVLVYMDYRSDLENQAAVRLDEIRLGMRGTPPAQIRSQLDSYIEQFGSTGTADQARILLAEMELERDSADAAIRLLEPIVDLDGGPLGYNAGWLRAVAEEQRGDRASAAEWYERLADAAPHEFQRRRARAALARLHEYAGEYAAAEEIYADLAAVEDPAEAAFYGVKLGEVRARAATNAPPPSVPEAPAATAAPQDGADSGVGADSIETGGGVAPPPESGDGDS